MFKFARVSRFADFGEEKMGGLSLRADRRQFPTGTVLVLTLGEELVGNVYNPSSYHSPLTIILPLTI